MHDKTHTKAQQPLLQVHDLKTYLYTSHAVIKAVDGVTLTIRHGEKVGLVGESGSGKSMTARSFMRLLPEPPARIVGGKVMLQGRDLVPLPRPAMRKVRGREISMVFQDPMSYLNPTMRVGDQIAEAITMHHGRENTLQEVNQALKLVGLSPDSGIARRYPHELSGGMRQRILIAIALSCKPKLLIADEPTTALDVTIQAQILKLLDDLCNRLNMALLLITHDLGIVAELCDRVYVMYAGQIVEEAETEALFRAPQHPYTRGLLEGVLSINEFKPVLKTIGGSVPDLSAPPAGCRFHPRCLHVMDKCLQEPPVYVREDGRKVRCWLYEQPALQRGQP